MVPNAQLRNFATSGIFAAAATVAIKVTDAATDYIYVTGLILTITTHANAKNVTFEDNAGTPVVCAVYNDLTVAAGANQGQPITYDFGKRGFKLTQGKQLQVVSDSAGPAGSFVAYGYQSGS